MNMKLTEKDKKYLKIGGIALVLGSISYFVFFRDKGPGTGGTDTDPTGNGGVTNPNNYVFNPTKIANDLYEAMRASGLASFLNPSEREVIMKTLEPINQTQFAQVIQKFGKKSYNETFGNQINYLPLTTLPLKGLAFWLKTELEGKDYNYLKLKYPNYL